MRSNDSQVSASVLRQHSGPRKGRAEPVLALNPIERQTIHQVERRENFRLNDLPLMEKSMHPRSSVSAMGYQENKLPEGRSSYAKPQR